ncbi:MAG: glutamate--tRNA ligase, partial [Candidatus Bathyarchaeia archaeon]
MTSNETKEVIRKIALLNAFHHEGKARAQSVLGKLLAERPHLKTKIKQVTSTIHEIVQEVNKLSLQEQKKLLEKKWPETLVKEKVEVTKKLPPLPNVENYERVVTRFSPNPDCALHLGSTRAIILCYEYAKMYDGLFYLRFEDTDPRLKKSALPFYDLIREDLTWLGCKWDREFIQSNRIPIYYEHAEKLLKNGHAYVCTCPRQEFREKVAAKQQCPCRDLTPKEQLARWKHMLNGTYGEGEAVMRIKTDLNHPNPAVREWPAFRIIDAEKHPHPRVGSKYRVWPLYNFACGVDDHLMGVTHIIRGKEHLTNQTRQEYMYRHFGWKYPEAIHYGRLKITGALLSKSKILEGFRSGIFKQWDDPRLATLAALRRRGIMPEAMRRLIIDVGPKTADVVLSWENLYAHNRKIIDPKANRYFFVHNPRKLTVKNVPHPFTAQIHLHPDRPERGFRLFEVKPKKGEASFWVSSDDVNIMVKGKTIRFMELFNFQVEKVGKQLIEAVFHSEAYEEAKKVGAPLIHWVPVGTGIPCEVVMPDASVAVGTAEDSCKKLRPDEVIQFERFGFVKVDSLNKKLTAY